MPIKTIKVLRLISKMILLVVSLCFVGYAGLVVYKSVVNRPMKVRITNITDSAATITWVTNNPVRGIVYYSDKDNVLSGPLGFLSTSTGYDDRDFAIAQEDCVNTFNANAKGTRNTNFAVSGSNFDCENIKVEKIGAYYTHSVTLKNLKEGMAYYFKVGNGIWSWGVNGVGKELSENDLPLASKFNFTTGKIASVVPVPNLAYGTVSAGIKSEEGYLSEDLSKDSLVFAYVTINNADSQLISTVTNVTGGWVFDKSNFRDSNGDLITNLDEATMTVCAQYEKVNPKSCSVISDLSEDTKLELLGNSEADMTSYQKSKILEKFEELVSKVYAAVPDCTKEDCSKYDLTEKACTNIGSVSGCSQNDYCIKKCPIKGTNLFDWVKYAELGTPGCSLPLYCGDCTEADSKRGCINAVANDNYSTKCENTTGGYFWKKYTTDNCTVATGNENCDDKCTYSDLNRDNGCPSDCDGSCVEESSHMVRANNQKCSNGLYCDGSKETCTREVPANSECSSAKNKDKRICEDGKGRCLDQKCDLWEGDDCPDGGPYTGTYSVDGKTCIPYPVCSHEGDTCTIDSSDEVGMCNGSLICISLKGKACTIDGNEGTYNGSGKCIANVIPSAACKFEGIYNSNGKLNSCNFICGSETRKITKKDCLVWAPNMPLTIDTSDPESWVNLVQPVNVDLESLTIDNIYYLVYYAPDGGALIKAELEKRIKDLLDDSDVCTESKLKKINHYAAGFRGCAYTCNSGKPEAMSTNCPTAMLNYKNFFERNIVSPVYADTDSMENSSYALYIPESGLYSFQVGSSGISVPTEITGGDTSYIFYIESNGISGFQMPVDPANPTSSEDIVLSTSAYQITYTQETSAQQYSIKKGVNIISFNFIATDTTSEAYTAGDVINQAASNGVTIQYITTYDSGRWSGGYSCKDGSCVGNDFAIIPGKGYMIYATQGGNITIPGYKLTSAIPIAFSAGWNLVGINGYTTAYTARSFIDSINKISGLVANNISWWPTSKSKYEGLQVDNGVQYGTDFSISPTNGYFVRISSFAPSNATCKTIIWQPGGSLNGGCGNTK